MINAKCKTRDVKCARCIAWRKPKLTPISLMCCTSLPGVEAPADTSHGRTPVCAQTVHRIWTPRQMLMCNQHTTSRSTRAPVDLVQFTTQCTRAHPQEARESSPTSHWSTSAQTARLRRSVQAPLRIILVCSLETRSLQKMTAVLTRVDIG